MLSSILFNYSLQVTKFRFVRLTSNTGISYGNLNKESLMPFLLKIFKKDVRRNNKEPCYDIIG